MRHAGECCHEHVGERAQEPEDCSKRTRRRREGAQHGHGGHGDRRPHGMVARRECDDVRARARPAAIPATRREILDGPVEPAAAIEAAANAERSVALMCGSVEPSANPATRPHTM
jgi:hypothetical protein